MVSCPTDAVIVTDLSDSGLGQRPEQDGVLDWLLRFLFCERVGPLAEPRPEPAVQSCAVEAVAVRLAGFRGARRRVVVFGHDTTTHVVELPAVGAQLLVQHVHRYAYLRERRDRSRLDVRSGVCDHGRHSRRQLPAVIALSSARSVGCSRFFHVPPVFQTPVVPLTSHLGPVPLACTKIHTVILCHPSHLSFATHSTLLSAPRPSLAVYILPPRQYNPSFALFPRAKTCLYHILAPPPHVARRGRRLSFVSATYVLYNARCACVPLCLLIVASVDILVLCDRPHAQRTPEPAASPLLSSAQHARSLLPRFL